MSPLLASDGALLPALLGSNGSNASAGALLPALLGSNGSNASAGALLGSAGMLAFPTLFARDRGGRGGTPLARHSAMLSSQRWEDLAEKFIGTHQGMYALPAEPRLIRVLQVSVEREAKGSQGQTGHLTCMTY